MPALARVIVEKQNGQWTAYFGDEPHTAVSGTKPTQAMQALLRNMGGGQFQESGVQLLAEATHNGHFEFLAPFQAGSLKNREEPNSNLVGRQILFSEP